MFTYDTDAALFDSETGCSPHWSAAEFSSAPRSFVYPSQAMPERRQVFRHPAGYQSPAVKQSAGKAPQRLLLTPTEWLGLWCGLEQAG